MTKKPKKQNIQVAAPAEAKNNSKICGINHYGYSNMLVNQVANASYYQQLNGDDKREMADALVVALVNFEPKDVIEGQLAAQMMACHNAAMDCYRRNMIPDQTFIGRQENMKQAAKLNRAYATLVEALNRHRGKVQQKMTVEHVHVNAGGQAIIGNVIRPEGGRVQTKTEE